MIVEIKWRVFIKLQHHQQYVTQGQFFLKLCRASLNADICFSFLVGVLKIKKSALLFI